MTEYLMDPLGPAGVASRCPGCGSHHTTWVSTGTQDNLLCKTCGVCWHDEGGRNGEVSLATCPGCEYCAVCEVART